MGNENFILEEEESDDMMSKASFTIDDDDKLMTADGASIVHCDEDDDGTSYDGVVKAKDATQYTVRRNTTSANSFQMMMEEKTAVAVKSKCVQIDFSHLSNSGSGDLFVKPFEESFAELFSSSFANLMTSSGYCPYYNSNGHHSSSLERQATAA